MPDKSGEDKLAKWGLIFIWLRILDRWLDRGKRRGVGVEVV